MEPSEAHPLMKYFVADHLPEEFKAMAGMYRDLAIYLQHSIPEGQDQTNAIRRLIESREEAMKPIAQARKERIEAETKEAEEKYAGEIARDSHIEAQKS